MQYVDDGREWAFHVDKRESCIRCETYGDWLKQSFLLLTWRLFWVIKTNTWIKVGGSFSNASWILGSRSKVPKKRYSHPSYSSSAIILWSELNSRKRNKRKRSVFLVALRCWTDLCSGVLSKCYFYDSYMLFLLSKLFSRLILIMARRHGWQLPAHTFQVFFFYPSAVSSFIFYFVFVGSLFGLFCCICLIWVVEIVTSFANVGLWVISFWYRLSGFLPILDSELK